MTAGGGTIAAYGLRYQYMITIERFLRHMRANLSLLPRTDLLVEPVVLQAGDESDDIVDFGLVVDDIHSHHYQVKSSLAPAENPLTPAPAREVLNRLHANPATHSALYTNKPLSPMLANSVAVDTGSALPDGVLMYRWPPDDSEVDASAYPAIYVDSRSEHEIRQSICALIREFRKDRQLSQGDLTCNSLVSVLLESIFSAAASNAPQRITALEFIELLAMPDVRIAQVVGGFDWGRVVANIPHYASTAPRIGYLDQLHGIRPGDTSMTPPRVVLVGHTGAGKSVIAADYCHVDAASFAFICWFDCRDLDYIESQAMDLFVQLTNDKIRPDGDVALAFAGALSGHPGPWLLVLDGVIERPEIERYLPTRGHGTILITSTNALGWWPDATVIEVGEFTLAEGISCFRAYSGISGEASDEVVGDVVNILGRVPLAVSMAGIYFANAEGDITELSDQYFSDLAALDDTLSIPQGFNQTAFKAIRHAVAKLGKRDPASHGTSARAVLEVGCLLAPEQIPLNLVLPATTEEVSIDVAHPPPPVEVEPAWRRGVVAVLRTQSIASRRLRPDVPRSPTNDTINIHPLIHQILQTSRLKTVPLGVLQQDATVFMHFLRGWLGSLRAMGDFLGTDQIRMHAEAVLAVVGEHEPLSSPSPQRRRVYLYTKALLLLELSTCHASRRRYEQSLQLAVAAGRTLDFVSDEPAARALTVPLLTNMIHDLSFLQAPVQVLEVPAGMAVGGITALVSDPRESYQDIGYTFAGDLRLWLTRTSECRSAQSLHPYVQTLQEIMDSDPRAAARPAATNTKINELYEAGNFHELGELVISLLGNADPSERIGLSALQSVADLHTGNFDRAIENTQQIIDLELPAGYLQHEVVEALSKIRREIYHLRVSPDVAIDPRLVTVLAAIEVRLEELADS
ncbi:hypothetical protein [Antrihabitans spumae]|uniref:NB-ARC domain-containing protein n=1 Tax=Antrihabitans spumae TaxID=3373370 RepID=A0ABW7K2Y9_9NOCA